jgi:ABC-type nitrate/sulfonate/bicarbonate transport system ATPase subunit
LGDGAEIILGGSLEQGTAQELGVPLVDVSSSVTGQVVLDKGHTEFRGAMALADRVLLLQDGRIALDQRIDLPRPRQRGSVELASLEQKILEVLLGAA